MAAARTQEGSSGVATERLRPPASRHFARVLARAPALLHGARSRQAAERQPLLPGHTSSRLQHSRSQQQQPSTQSSASSTSRRMLLLSQPAHPQQQALAQPASREQQPVASAMQAQVALLVSTPLQQQRQRLLPDRRPAAMPAPAFPTRLTCSSSSPSSCPPARQSTWLLSLHAATARTAGWAPTATASAPTWTHSVGWRLHIRPCQAVQLPTRCLVACRAVLLASTALCRCTHSQRPALCPQLSAQWTSCSLVLALLPSVKRPMPQQTLLLPWPLSSMAAASAAASAGLRRRPCRPQPCTRQRVGRVPLVPAMAAPVAAAAVSLAASTP